MKLRFECVGCGDCCRRARSLVYFSATEVKAAAGRLKMTPDHFRERFLERYEDGLALYIPDDSACPFLLDDACTIQDVKPEQCRTYPFWPEILDVEGAWEGEAAECPGVGRGREYTADEVARLRVGSGATDE